MLVYPSTVESKEKIFVITTENSYLTIDKNTFTPYMPMVSTDVI